MRGFRFTLQPLLERRIEVEREKQRAVAELEGRRASLEGVIRGAQDVARQQKADMRSAMTAKGASVVVDPSLIRFGAAAGFRAQVKARQAAVSLAGVLARLEAARGELREAAKARRAMELLRDRRHAAWKARLAKAEAHELDEIAMGRAARRAAGAADEPATGTEVS